MVSTRPRWQPAVLLVLALAIPNTQPLTAEEVIKRSAVSEVDQAQFEKNLEERLTRDVKSYLGHDFFITRANALLENVQIYERKEKMVPAPNAPAQVPPQQPQPPAQPVLTPDQNEAVAQMELDTEDGIDTKSVSEMLGVDAPLPGLPVPETVFEPIQPKIEQAKPRKKVAPPPPPQAQPQPPIQAPPPMEKEVVETLQQTRIDVKKLAVKVMLDEHITPEQEIFIRQLVIEKSGLSFIRGDELQITRSKFPGAVVLDPKPEPEVEKKPEPAVEPPPAPEAAKTPEEPKAKEIPVEAEEPVWLSMLKQYGPLLAGVLIVLAMMVFMRKKKKDDERKQQEMLTRVVEVPEVTKKFDKLIAEMSRKEEVISENRLQAIREEVMSMAVTDYPIISGQLADWLASGNDEELARVAVLHHLVGQGAFTSLFRPILSAERLVALAAKAQEIKEQTAQSDLVDLAESVYQQVIQRRYDERTKRNQELKPFEFLEELNDEQILYLLNDENLKVKALVYSQLPSDRGAGLLKRAAAADRTKLATEIAKFSQLPVLAFKDVANRLAKKATNVPSFANIDVDGVDLLINMLDHMKIADETTMLNSLQKDNPQLFYQIKKVYVSFSDLIRLPTMALKNLLREVEREQLATALFDMDESFRTAVYSALLERPRAMLQSTLKNMPPPDETAVNDAKRAVARKAREMLKAGAIQLAQEPASGPKAVAS